MALSTQLTILDKEKKEPSQWIFTAEQDRLAREITEGDDLEWLVLKSRQVGMSTFFSLLDVVLAIINPRIRVAIVVHKQELAEARLADCREFLLQLGVPLLKDQAKLLVLENGSEIHAVTAGSSVGEASRVGRSQSFQVLHITELPYWSNQDAFHSIRGSSPGAVVYIETTAQGTDELFARLWKQLNTYRKVFFSVEEHVAYRLAEQLITDEDWVWAQSLGFTRRDTAAYVVTEWRSRGCPDIVRFLYDYPVVEDQCFQISHGRWIAHDPVVLEASQVGIDLSHSYSPGIKIFQPREPLHKYVAGVDTADCEGRDGCAIAVIDRSTGKLVASWKDNRATIHELVETCHLLRQYYQDIYFVIEKNGVGVGTKQEAARSGLPFTWFNATDGTKRDCLHTVRDEVVNGRLFGPSELLDECKSLHVTKHGKVRGPKDLIMACGFALLERRMNPYTVPEVRRSSETHYYEDDEDQEGDLWV